MGSHHHFLAQNPSSSAATGHGRPILTQLHGLLSSIDIVKIHMAFLADHSPNWSHATCIHKIVELLEGHASKSCKAAWWLSTKALIQTYTNVLKTFNGEWKNPLTIYNPTFSERGIEVPTKSACWDAFDMQGGGARVLPSCPKTQVQPQHCSSTLFPSS